MSRIKKFLIISIAVSVIALGGFIIWLSGHYVVPIMMYHSVANSDTVQSNTVSPANFQKQMAYLKKRKFNVLSFNDLVQLIRSEKPIPKKSVVITFDDGYADNYTNAFNILKQYGYPAIMFIPSDLIGNVGYLTWGQVREMASYGIAFGSHTRHHNYLPDLNKADQKDEIFESKRILEQRLGRSINYFAYPIGGFSDSIKKQVGQAGYMGAAATNRGADRLNKDVYELNRIRFGNKDNRNDYLWIKLSGYYNLFREVKNPN